MLFKSNKITADKKLKFVHTVCVRNLNTYGKMTFFGSIPEWISKAELSRQAILTMALGVSVALLVFSACAVGFAEVRFLRRKREKKKKAVDLEADKK